MKKSLPRVFPSFARRPPGRWVTWPRLLATALALGAVGWAGTATAVWAYLHWGRNLSRVNWFDVSLPHRWPGIGTAIGEKYFEDAALAVQQRDFSRALLLYRIGLARSPRNPQARLALAELYAAARHPELAKPILIDGIGLLSDDRRYLEAALRFLLDRQWDQELAAACDTLLARPPNRTNRSLVGLYAATVAHLRGDYDRAENLLRAHDIARTPEGMLLLAQIDRDRGFPDLALLRLSDLVQTGAATDQVYVLIGQILRSLGRSRELELNAAQRLAHSPLSFAPRLAFLQLHHDRGRSDALAREIESYFSHFAGDRSALLALADFAATTARPTLVQRVEQHFLACGWPVDALPLLAAEAHLAAADPSRALGLLTTSAQTATTDPRLAPVFDSLQAVALFDLNRPDEAHLHLERLLSRANLRAENLHVVAARLLARGQTLPAAHLLARAVALDPLNQSALTEFVRLEADRGSFSTLPAHVRRLLQMRRPAPDALAHVRHRWGSDRNLFHPEQAALLAELDRALRRNLPGNRPRETD